MLAADSRPRPLRRCGHGDAPGPDPAPGRRARGPRPGAGQPDPARRLGHAGQPAALSTPAGRAFHLLASAWAVGPVQDTQCGFKGFTPRGCPRPVQPTGDHEHRVRRGADLPRAPAGLPDRDRADPVGGQARVAHAPRTTAGAPGCLGPAPDPVHRSSIGGCRGGRRERSSGARGPAPCGAGGPAGARDPRADRTRRRDPRRGRQHAGLRLPDVRRRGASAHGRRPALRPVVLGARPERPVRLPADLHPRDPPVRRGALPACGVARVDRDAQRGLRRGGRDPSRPTRDPLGRPPARRALLAVPLRGEAGPAGAAPLPAVRDRLALGRPARGRRRVGRARHRREAPAAPPVRVGPCDTALPRRGRRARRPRGGRGRGHLGGRPRRVAGLARAHLAGREQRPHRPAGPEHRGHCVSRRGSGCRSPPSSSGGARRRPGRSRWWPGSAIRRRSRSW